MKHAILGAGAIGGLMAVALSSIGEDVTLIIRAEKLADYPHTLAAETPSGAITVPAKTAVRVSGPADVLWISTKTYHLEDALAVVEAMPRIVVPLLNGVDHIAVLRARFGQDRVVPATIAVEADRSAEGHFIQRSVVRLGVASSGEAVLRDTLEKLRSLGWTCHFVANEATLLWTKLCFLEPFALATSASGKNLGEILADREWKDRFESAIHEACAVAAKEGAEVDGSKGAAAFVNYPSTMRASMAKDLAAGREPELDGIAGPVLRGGEKHGVPTPTTCDLVEKIEEKERAKRSPARQL